MATKKDIKEGAIFKTPNGRIGKVYAITERNIQDGTVNLFFEGAGCVFAGENYAPPSGVFYIDILEVVK